MPEARLKGKLTLDDSQYHAALRKATAAAGMFAAKVGNVLKAGATAAIVGVTAAAVAMTAALASAIKTAIDLGGKFSDVAAQAGEAVGKLVIYSKALDDAGIGGENLGAILNKMQKALEENSDAFSDLGINLEDIRKQSPTDQLTMVGKALMQVKDPATRAASAMEIFGRTGGKMLTLFSDSSALANASKVLGSMPGMLEENAALFDKLSDGVGSFGTKWDAFAVGITSKLAPTLEPIVDKILALDSANIGQALGADIMAVFGGQVGGDAIASFAGNFVKAMAAAATAAGLAIKGALSSALAEPIAEFQARIDAATELILGLLSKEGSSSVAVAVDTLNRRINSDKEALAALEARRPGSGTKKKYLPGVYGAPGSGDLSAEAYKSQSEALRKSIAEQTAQMNEQLDIMAKSGGIGMESIEDRKKRILADGVKVGWGGGTTSGQDTEAAAKAIRDAMTLTSKATKEILPRTTQAVTKEAAKAQNPATPKAGSFDALSPAAKAQQIGMFGGADAARKQWDAFQARATSPATRRTPTPSLLSSPSRVVGGVRKRGESREEFRARMDKAKGIEKKEQDTGEAIKNTSDNTAKILAALEG